MKRVSRTGSGIGIWQLPLESGSVRRVSSYLLKILTDRLVFVGYGATTFPGLTEALTYDKNVTLAEQEADRLKELINGLAAKLKA